MGILAGVDLGGTNIEAALLSEQGKVMSHITHPTGADEGYGRVMENIISAVKKIKKDKEIEAIGLCSPGIIDVDQGICRFAGNLNFNNVQLRRPIEDAFSVPVFVENDVNAAALGEWRFGTGKGTDNFILVMLGTGVGAGIITDGRLLHGKSNATAEIGHTIVEKDGLFCNCGGRGCLEMYASATGIVRMMKKYLSEGNYSDVLQDMRGGESLTAAVIAKRAAEGDRLSLYVLRRAAKYLGVALVNYVNTFNPEVIAIGGGVAKAGDIFLNPVRDFIADRAMDAQAKDVTVVRSSLGDDAGTVGAAAAAIEGLKKANDR